MKIRIYQICMDRDHNRVAFQSIDRLKRFQGSSQIDCKIYDKVFEGDVACEDLEEVFRMFNISQPKGYKGRSLSVSDVVEVIGTDGESTYHFCDDIGFRKVNFDPGLVVTDEEAEDEQH